MMSDAERLRAIMTDYGLRPKDVGRMLSRSDITVRSWLQARNPRKIPEHTLELLEHKLIGRRKSNKIS